MSASDKVLTLITRFDNNFEAYRSGKYNKTQLLVVNRANRAVS